MHEVSLVQALFDQVDRAIPPHPSSALRQVTLRIGKLSGVECGLFRTAFDCCKSERGYSNATLDIVEELAVWACSECGAVISEHGISEHGPLRCAACDGTPALSTGGELILQRLELELAHV